MAAKRRYGMSSEAKQALKEHTRKLDQLKEYL
jgi:hypothetical protein